MAEKAVSSAEIYLSTAGEVVGKALGFVYGLKIDESKTLQSWNDALFGALFSTAAALSAWIKLLVYTATVVFWGVVSVFEEYHPQIRAAFSKLVEIHSKLSFAALAAEVACFFLLGYMLWHRKALLARWKRFEESVAQKSRLVASLLPHIAFFLCVSAAAYLLRDLLPFIAHAKVITLLLTVPHAISTYQDVRAHDFATYERHLMYWCIFALHEAVSMIVAYVPLGMTVLSYIPMWRSWLVLTALWMQLPMGTQMMYSMVLPILQNYAKKLPDVDTSYFSTLVYPLTVAGFIPKETGAVIGELARDGLVVIVGGFCMLSLGPLAVAGAVVVCVLMPAYHSLKLTRADATSASGAAASAQQAAAGGQKQSSWFSRMFGGQSAQDPASAAETAEYQLRRAKERWLQYWICYAALSAFRWVIMPGMWPQFLIGISLWLLTSYFHGAATTITFVEEFYHALRNGEFQRSNEAEAEEGEEDAEEDEEEEGEEEANEVEDEKGEEEEEEEQLGARKRGSLRLTRRTAQPAEAPPVAARAAVVLEAAAERVEVVSAVEVPTAT